MGQKIVHFVTIHGEHRNQKKAKREGTNLVARTHIVVRRLDGQTRKLKLWNYGINEHNGSSIADYKQGVCGDYASAEVVMCGNGCVDTCINLGKCERTRGHSSAVSAGYGDHPLQAKIEAGQLVIRIGVKRLAKCSTNDDLGALHGRKITDPEEFCEDVIREMMIEDEVGNTPLIQFLGEMGIAAFYSGSLAVEL